MDKTSKNCKRKFKLFSFIVKPVCVISQIASDKFIEGVISTAPAIGIIEAFIFFNEKEKLQEKSIKNHR